MDKVPNDEEIAGKTHTFDGGQLEVDTLAHHLVPTVVLAVARLGSLVGEVTQVFHFGRERFGQRESGQQDVMGQFEIFYLFHDLARVFKIFGMPGKHLCHFLGTLEVFLSRIEHLGLFVEFLSGIETYEDPVRLVIVGIDEMHVVGGDALHAVFGGKLFQTRVHNHLLVMAVTLQFEIIIVAEQGLVKSDMFLELSLLAGKDGLRHFARQASRTADEAFVILLQQFVVDTGLVIKRFLSLGIRAKFHQVVVAGDVLGQKDKVVVAPFFPARLFKTALGRHIYLAAHDRLDALFFRRVDEFHDPVHVAMVGDGHGIHAVFLGLFHQGGYLAGSVEHGIERMQVKVGEIGHLVVFYRIIFPIVRKIILKYSFRVWFSIYFMLYLILSGMIRLT